MADKHSCVRELQHNMSTGSLPSLPGHQLKPALRQNYPRPNRLQITRQGNRYERDRTPLLDENLRVLRNESPRKLYVKKQEILKQWEDISEAEKLLSHKALKKGEERVLNSSKSQPSLRVEPAWVKHDRHVLRFYMFFKEAVHESALESYRVRKCVLYFFMSDGTISISEPREENSGMPQGNFLTRRKIVNEVTGESFKPADFAIGSENTIYGKCFRVVDCDPTTKEYFKEHGLPVGEPEEYPEDPHRTRGTELKNSGLKSKQRRSKSFANTPYNNKVLNFICIWDDSGRMLGEKTEYKLTYHLNDSTVEVHSLRAGDFGKHPVLVKRQKLVRDLSQPEQGHYSDEDLKCGEYIDCFRRKLLLLSCDNFTRKYYERVYNYKQKQVDHAKTPRPMYTHKIPPYNGFGSEDDSLANCLALVPRPVGQDVKKFMKHHGKELLFRAKFKDPAPGNEDRIFAITYYMEDDTVSIFEPPRKNSGILGGKFLERGRYKLPIKEKQANNTALELEDIIFEKIQSRMLGGPFLLLRAFQKFSKDDGKGIGFANFKVGLRSVGILPEAATDSDLYKLFQQYDVSGDGKIDFQEFVDKVMKERQRATNEGPFTSRWLRPGDFYVGAVLRFMFLQTGSCTDEFVITGATSRTFELMEEHKETFPKSNVDEVVASLGKTLSLHNVKVTDAFKNIDSDRKGWISAEEFMSLLKKWSVDFGLVDSELSEQECLTLFRLYDENNDGKIVYSEFCDALVRNNSYGRAKIVFSKNFASKEGGEEVDPQFVQPEEELRRRFSNVGIEGSTEISLTKFNNTCAITGIHIDAKEFQRLQQHFQNGNNALVGFDELCAVLFHDPTKLVKKLELDGARAENDHEVLEYQHVLDINAARKSDAEHVLELMKSFSSFFRRKSTLFKNCLKFDLDRRGTIKQKDFIEALARSNPDYCGASRQVLLSYIFRKNPLALAYEPFIEIMFSQDANAALKTYGKFLKE